MNKPTRKDFINSLTIVLLVFLMPIGLLVMWLFSTWTKKIKIVVTIIIFIILVLSLTIPFLIASRTITSVQDKATVVMIEKEIKETKELLSFYYQQNGEYPPDLKVFQSWLLEKYPQSYFPLSSGAATKREGVRYIYEKTGLDSFKLSGEFEGEIVYAVEVREPTGDVDILDQKEKIATPEKVCGAIEDSIRRSECFTEIAFFLKDPYLCDEATPSLGASCWEAFGMRHWQLYRSTFSNYQVMYPEDWEIKTDALAKSTYLTPKAKRIPEGVWVFVSITRKEDLQVQPFYNPINFFGKPVPIPEEIKINEREFYKSEEKFEGIRDIKYAISNQDGSKIGWIALSIRYGRQRMDYYLPNKEIESELKIFNQMLSTFRFLE